MRKKYTAAMKNYCISPKKNKCKRRTEARLFQRDMLILYKYFNYNYIYLIQSYIKKYARRKLQAKKNVPEYIDCQGSLDIV